MTFGTIKHIYFIATVLLLLLLLHASSATITNGPQSAHAQTIKPAVKWILQRPAPDDRMLPDSLADTTVISLWKAIETSTYQSRYSHVDTTVNTQIRGVEPCTVSFELDNGMPAEQVDWRQIRVKFNGNDWALLDVRSDVRLARFGSWDLRSSNGQTLDSGGILSAQLVITDHAGKEWVSPPATVSVKPSVTLVTQMRSLEIR